MKVTPSLAAAMLAAAKTELDGGRLYMFAGPVPAEAADALDMVNDHTLVVEMTESNDGVTGLTFTTPTGSVLAKTAAEDWLGLIDFDGAVSGPGTITPTFFRFCAAGDNGQGASTDPRIQGTVGGPASSAEAKMPDGSTLTDNGTNTRGAAMFNINLTTIG